MSRLRILNSNGYQVYPEVSGSKQASGQLLECIHQRVDFYVDPDAPRVVSFLQADSPSVRGRRRANFHAEFIGEDRGSLFEDFVEALKSLDNSEDWTLFRDSSALNMPWITASAAPTSLQDAGIDSKYQLILDSLLDEGITLDLGVQDYETAGAVFKYITHQTSKSVSMAVSSNGRVEGLESTNLVFVPSERHFHPLTDQTRSAISKKNKDIEQIVRQKIYDGSIDAIESLVSTADINTWTLFQELSALENVVRSDADQSFETSDAEKAAELLTALQTGQEVDNVDPALLSNDEQNEILRSIIKRVQAELEDLKENMPEYVREDFNTQLDRLTEANHTAGTEVTALRAIRQILNGNALDESTEYPAPVYHIRELVNELPENRRLSTPERDQIKSDVEGTVQERLKKRLRRRQNRYRARAERLFEELSAPTSTDDDKWQRIGVILNALTEVIEQPEDTNLPNSEIATEFQNLIRDLKSDDILDESAVRTLVQEFEQQIIDRRHELREELAAAFKEEFDQLLEDLKESNPSTTIYEQLNQLSNLCVRNPESVDGQIPQRFRTLVTSVNDHPLLSAQQQQELRAEFEQRIEKEQEVLRNQTRKRHHQIVSNQIKDLDGLPTHEEQIQALKKIKSSIEQGLSKPLQAVEPVGNKQIPTITEQVNKIINSYHSGPLTAEDVEKLREGIREDIQDEITQIQAKEQDRIESDFEGLLNQFDGFELPPKIEWLRTTKDALENPGTSINTPDRVQGHHAGDLVTDIESVIKAVQSPEYVGLSNDQQIDLRKSFTSKLDTELGDAQAEYAHVLVDRIESTVEDAQRQYELDSNPHDVQNYIEYLSAVQQAVRRPQKSAPSAEIATQIEDAHSLLASTHREHSRGSYETFESKVDERLDETIQTYQGVLENTIEKCVKSEINRICELDLGQEARIRLLEQLRQIVYQKSARMNVRLVDGSQESISLTTANLDELCYELENQRQETLRKHIKEIIQELSNELAGEYRQKIVTTIEEYSESEVDEPTIGIDRFESFLDGEQYSPDHPKLSAAVETYNEFRQLNNDNVIEPEHFRETTQNIRKDIQEYRTAGRQNGFHSTFRKYQPSLSNSSLMGTFGVAFAVLILVFFAWGGFLPLGGAPPVSSSPGGPVAVNNVSVSETSDGLLVQGDVSEAVANVSVQVITDRETRKRATAIEVANRSFSRQITIGHASSYILMITPTSAQGATGESSVHTFAPGSPTLEIQQPTWESTITQDHVRVMASTSGSQYQVYLLNKTGATVASQQGKVSGGQINETLSSQPGTYHILVFVSDTSGNTTTQHIPITVRTTTTENTTTTSTGS